MITASTIRSVVEEKIEGTEVFIVDVVVGGKKIQVLLDTDTGITVGQCSEVGKYLANHEEMEGVLEVYDMEVGSPGMGQSLKVPRQYKRRIGTEFSIRTNDDREISGVLTKAGENDIELMETVTRKEGKKKISEQVTHNLGYNEIKEAKMIFSFGQAKKK